MVWAARRGLMLLVTGLVIEIALMPIVLFHFHRAGVYGAFANVIAIPLTTFVSMPLIALALLFDAVGLGAPFWWLAGKSLELLLGNRPLDGRSTRRGQTDAADGGMDLRAICRERALAGSVARQGARCLACVPICIATVMLLTTPVPDVLISGDGRHVGITGEADNLLVLRETRSDFTRDNLLELAGMEGEILPLANWQGAQCSRDFCVDHARPRRAELAAADGPQP